MDLLLKCEICEEKFDHKDHRPCILRCGHSLCSKCIARSFETSEGILKCPFCRFSCRSATAKVSEFTENFTLLKMIDAEEQKQKKACAKSESVLVKEKNLDKLRQIEITGSKACISICNNRLEELKKVSKTFQTENDALEARKKELQLELEKIEKKKVEINSKSELHKSNVRETLDLLRKIESSLECLKTAISIFGLNLAAQDINICRGIIQDWGQIIPYSSDPPKKKSEREVVLSILENITDEKLKKEAEDMANHSLLSLMWSLAHLDYMPTEIIYQAMDAQVKFLNYACSQNRDTQKKHWLDRCVEELKNNKWVLPALKQIKKICFSYSEGPENLSQDQCSTPNVSYRNNVISKLQIQHSLVVLVADNLTLYMNNIRNTAKENPEQDPADIIPDGRYNHTAQVQERLSFLQFLLKDGYLWLCAPQANQIWDCLAKNAVFTEDRESCFNWLTKLMEDDSLDPEIIKDFFKDNIQQLDPSLLTEKGMECFDLFSRSIN